MRYNSFETPFYVYCLLRGIYNNGDDAPDRLETKIRCMQSLSYERIS